MLGTNFDPFNQLGNKQRPLAGTPQDGGKKATRNKVLRYMFNPELGEDFKNFSQNHTQFLKLVANIFLQTGLIDASYLGFTDPSQLGLKSLLETAYRNLRFTRDGMPQVLLYFAFVGSLVVVALSIVFFILSLGSNPRPPSQ
jgi:hypothetical protein